MRKRAKIKPDITLKQYELIFRIVSSIAEQFSHGAGRSCQFYNINGAFILSRALKISARPVMGAAFVRLNDEGDTLAYAGEENGEFYSSPDSFHCWIETPNYYIDFSAPEYGEFINGVAKPMPRKMFQKPKNEMSKGPKAMLSVGEFHFAENVELTQHLLSKMQYIPATNDFAIICLDWFNKSKKKTLKELDVTNDIGKLTKIKLKNGGIFSAW